MNQNERRKYLIQELLSENTAYSEISVPDDVEEGRQLLRGLMNIRPPRPIGKEFLRIQDEYLQRETERKGITELDSLTPVQDGLYLWQEMCIRDRISISLVYLLNLPFIALLPLDTKTKTACRLQVNIL